MQIWEVSRMSVSIKNMDMPKNCDECLFGDWSNLHQTATCKLLEYEPCFADFSRGYESARSDKCPLVAPTIEPSAQPEITKEYNLKKIYNIYVKIAQAHFVYQPSKPKAITAMPFDWIETQNLLEKYLEDHGADFDALCREYVSENVKDDHLPSAQPEIKPIGYRDCANAMMRMWMDNVITDGEYNRIMDRLNAHWKR